VVAGHSGRLSGAERRRLLVAIAIGQLENLASRARLALGRLPRWGRASIVVPAAAGCA
jgi:hypothetical protein